MSGSASSAAADSLTHWKRNQAAVTVAAFIGFTGFTLVMPFLSLYLQDLGEHSTAAVAIWSGLCLGITPLVTAFMTPVWARLAVRTGPKLMVERSLVSFVVIMTLMAWVSHPWQVFALRFIQGFFAGYGPMAMMLAAESAPPEHMATAIGWVQTSQRLGPALGPVLGSALLALVGIRGTFYASAAVYFLGFLLIVLVFHEPPRTSRRAAAAAPRAAHWRDVRALPGFVVAVAIVFGLQLVDRSFGPVLPLYLSEIGVPDGRVAMLTGVIFTLSAFAAAVGNQVTSWLLERRSARWFVAVSALAAALGAAVFAVCSAAALLLAASIVFGFAMGVATTAVYTDAGHRIDQHARAVAFGYLQTAYLIGLAVSPVLAGLVGARSMRAVFVVDAAGLALLAALANTRMVREAHAA